MSGLSGDGAAAFDEKEEYVGLEGGGCPGQSPLQLVSYVGNNFLS